MLTAGGRLELADADDRGAGGGDERLVPGGVRPVPLLRRVGPLLFVPVDEDQILRHLTSNRAEPGSGSLIPSTNHPPRIDMPRMSVGSRPPLSWAAMYVVILAGGGGTRLWPLSRQERPKPFLPLVDDRSLLQHTVGRILPLVDESDIFCVADRRYGQLVRDQVPDVGLIVEPAGRNTAAAIALARAVIDRPDDEVMVVLPADHWIARRGRPSATSSRPPPSGSRPACSRSSSRS